MTMPAGQKGSLLGRWPAWCLLLCLGLPAGGRAAALVLAAGDVLRWSGSVHPNSTVATNQPFNCDVSDNRQDWIEFTAPFDGQAILFTTNTVLDTYLQVFRQFKFVQNRIACDDNSGADGRLSRIRIPIDRDIPYFARAGSVTGGTAPIEVIIIAGQAPTVTAGCSLTYSVPQGGEVALGVEATGSPAPAFQWFLNDTPLPQGTQATLVITNAQPDQAGSYRVRVNNLFGEVHCTNHLAVLSPRMEFAGPLLPGGPVPLRVVNLAGHGRLVVQSSQDMVDWQDVLSTNVTGAALEFAAPAANQPHRFYRARWQP